MWLCSGVPCSPAWVSLAFACSISWSEPMKLGLSIVVLQCRLSGMDYSSAHALIHQFCDRLAEALPAHAKSKSMVTCFSVLELFIQIKRSRHSSATETYACPSERYLNLHVSLHTSLVLEMLKCAALLARRTTQFCFPDNLSGKGSQ